jgi:hypothetical protein
MTSFATLDDIEIGESAPFDLQLKMPVEAVRCVLNVHAKRVLQDIGVALQGYVSKTHSPVQSGPSNPDDVPGQTTPTVS